ncbi:MAG: inorganic pyrophosphatase [Chitinophagaceae bacterium]|nr:inorganic pyrophosphatase [Oligoflexus sp.]
MALWEETVSEISTLIEQFKHYFKPHPWHGIPVWGKTPYLNVFIEIVPTDTVKYELDKDSGYLSIDRPQKFSNIVPALYGFVPQTYCGDTTAAFAAKESGLGALKGDADPLDICVLTERTITHGDILVLAKPIGGFRMIDQGEADDKIIAVLKDDSVFGDIDDISQCPPKVLDRLKHYFLTYKDIPGSGKERQITIEATYGAKDALKVIELSANDYRIKFPESFPKK